MVALLKVATMPGWDQSKVEVGSLLAHAVSKGAIWEARCGR